MTDQVLIYVCTFGAIVLLGLYRMIFGKKE